MSLHKKKNTRDKCSHDPDLSLLLPSCHQLHPTPNFVVTVPVPYCSCMLFWFVYEVSLLKVNELKAWFPSDDSDWIMRVPTS